MSQPYATFPYDRYKSAQGFTLIEVLITLTIISVGVLSLGGFSISSLSTNQISRERLTAIHLAEQLLDEWQQTEILPTLSAANYCKIASTWTITTPSPSITAPCPTGTAKTITESSADCIPLFGDKISYKITVRETPLCGPSNIKGKPFVFFKGTAKVPSPESKLVTVSWTHQGKKRSVYLTHISRIQ